MSELTEKKCQPCEGKTNAFNQEAATHYLKQTPQWNISGDSKIITRNYVAKNFLAAVELINTIAAIAEQENHHPDVHLTSYKNLAIDLSTHAIGGLSENDFILAAKIDRILDKE